MADQKVSDLPSLNGVDVDPADLLYIVDSSAGTAGSKKITIGQFQLSPWSAGTVNGVLYFDGSKVPASSSALTFDGTNLVVGSTSVVEKLSVTQGNIHVLRTGGAKMRLADQNNEVSVESLPVGGASEMVFKVNTSEVGRFSTTGNFGLGVTPSAWSSSAKAIQFNTRSAVFGFSDDTHIAQNTYYDSVGYKYIATGGAASNYRQTAGQHQWYTAPSGTAGNAISFTQAMTLDASGNLGIGTATPATKLSILGGASGTDTRATIGNLATALQVGVDSSNNAVVATNTANNLGLYTNNLERVTIDSVGTVLVGTNSNPNGYKFHVYATGDAPATGIFAMSATTPYGMNIYYGSAAPNNSNANTSFLYCNDTSALRIQLASNGGVINYQANNSNLSDRREKKDFAPAKSYLDTICAIPVQTFKYIDQTDDAPTLGVVAQDVQSVAPELVMESNWGTEDNPKMRLSIYQTDLQYALMKSIQELKTALDAANARIAKLEAK